MLNKDDIFRRLTTKRFGRNLYSFDTLDSTNTFARSLVSSGAPDGTLVLADEQSKGKGRLGRSWHSTPGKNLLFSLIIRPTLPTELFGLISLYAAVAVSRGIGTCTGMVPACKWPNDILLNEKKVAGILSEMMLDGGSRPTVVLGIGVNVNEREFPRDLRYPPTSLALSCGKDFDRAELLCAILAELESLARELDDSRGSAIIDLWNAHSAMTGKTVEVELEGKKTRGTASGIAKDGRLILDTPEGRIEVFAGDTTLV